jgi:hypothetical protein
MLTVPISSQSVDREKVRFIQTGLPRRLRNSQV